MQWASHEVTTFFTVLALTGNPVFAVFSLPGSIFPDVCEFWGSPETSWERHRTYGHLTGVWLIATILLFLFSLQTPVYDYLSRFTIRNLLLRVHEYLFLDFRFLYTPGNVFPGIMVFLAWFSFGALMHCIEDALTGRVPVFNPGKRSLSFGHIITGSLVEHVLVFLYVAWCIIWIYLHQFR